jgi:hypothetical protein
MARAPSRRSAPEGRRVDHLAPSKIWKTAGGDKERGRRRDDPGSEMKHDAIAAPEQEGAVNEGDWATPIADSADPDGPELRVLPAPTAALIRMPTAMDRPSGSMKVSAAHEIAIWWAARARLPASPSSRWRPRTPRPRKGGFPRPAGRPRACGEAVPGGRREPPARPRGAHRGVEAQPAKMTAEPSVRDQRGDAGPGQPEARHAEVPVDEDPVEERVERDAPSMISIGTQGLPIDSANWRRAR